MLYKDVALRNSVAIHCNSEYESMIVTMCVNKYFIDKGEPYDPESFANILWDRDKPSNTINVEYASYTKRPVRIGHCYLEWYEEEGYTIYEFDDFDWSEFGYEPVHIITDSFDSILDLI